jgi:hypothetical protein
MSTDGTGMTPAPNAGSASGAVTSSEATAKKPYQGKFKSAIQTKRPPVKIDTNKHGIRRETTPQQPKKTGRKKV